jgi:hypothetical protein
MKQTYTDNHDILINPGMGFTHYEYSNQAETYGSRLDYSDTVDEFPGLSTIYLRLAWGTWNRRRGASTGPGLTARPSAGLGSTGAFAGYCSQDCG